MNLGMLLTLAVTLPCLSVMMPGATLTNLFMGTIWSIIR